MKCVQFNDEKMYIEDFLAISKKLYQQDHTENPNEIKKLLRGTHPLSHYFKLNKFLIYQNDRVAGRFVITIYPDDSTAYIGFFECVNNMEAAAYLFDQAYQFAKKQGLARIVGPVDASFWIKYRLKINMFKGVPYTGEPYNKDYYYKLFLDNEYQVVEHYTSNVFGTVGNEYENEKYHQRYLDFLKKGYQIQSVDMSEFEMKLKELYQLLTELYSDFPIYKHVSEEDFIELFRDYKKIMNPQMVKFAYYQNQLVGFFISVPNYHNLVYHLNLFGILKLLKQKRHPKEYVMLYMGVDQSHKGLGKALAYSIMMELRSSHLPSIGALARDGKVTQNYAEDLIECRYEYVLLEKKIL